LRAERPVRGLELRFENLLGPHVPVQANPLEPFDRVKEAVVRVVALPQIRVRFRVIQLGLGLEILQPWSNGAMEEGSCGLVIRNEG